MRRPLIFDGITTEVIPATSTGPTRILAQCLEGHLYFDIETGCDMIVNHEKARDALAAKYRMGNLGPWIGGRITNDMTGPQPYCWVRAESHVTRKVELKWDRCPGIYWQAARVEGYSIEYVELGLPMLPSSQTAMLHYGYVTREDNDKQRRVYWHHHEEEAARTWLNAQTNNTNS
jgi:hypothetical protein